MRALLVLLAACGGSDDLDATAQGACSNLGFDACAADATCQPAFLESSGIGGPFTVYFHCLAADGQAHATSCPAGHDACRATGGCSPLFHQDSQTDGPIGDPYYTRCELTTTLASEVITD